MCPRRVIVLFRKATRRGGVGIAAQMANGSAAREETQWVSRRVSAPGGEKGWLGHGAWAGRLVGCSGLLGGWLLRCHLAKAGDEDRGKFNLHLRGYAASAPVLDALNSAVFVVSQALGKSSGAAKFFNQFCIAHGAY